MSLQKSINIKIKSIIFSICIHALCMISANILTFRKVICKRYKLLLCHQLLLRHGVSQGPVLGHLSFINEISSVYQNAGVIWNFHVNVFTCKRDNKNSPWDQFLFTKAEIGVTQWRRVQFSFIYC